MSSRSDADFAPKRSRRIWGPLFGLACFLATLTGVVVLVILLGAVFATVSNGTSFPEVMTFLGRIARSSRNPDPELAGFKAGIAGSLWLLALVFVIAIPVGSGAAVFLEEYMPDSRIKRIIQMNVANLAAVPSIVYGILGLAVFSRGLGIKSLAMGPMLIAGGLTLSLLVLPVVVIATQEALRTVPSSLRQAALALGGTKWQVIRDHVLPSAMPGMLTGAILALSRAIGETAPVLMIGAAATKIPRGMRSQFAALPVEIYRYATEPAKQFRVVSAGGILILLALLLTMNATAIIIRNRFARNQRG